VLVDQPSAESIIVDAAFEAEKIAAAAWSTTVKAIVQTHCHSDHVQALDEVKRLTGAPVGIHPADEEAFGIPADFPLEHGVRVNFGAAAVEVIHTPGHTPGGCCFLIGRHCVCGDTVFPGGPGMTRSAEAFEQLIASITGRLYTLPEGTMLYPGHGENTTVGASKREYAVFAAKERTKAVFGEVTWAGA